MGSAQAGRLERLEIAGYVPGGARSLDYVLTGAQMTSTSVDPSTGLEIVNLNYGNYQETKSTSPLTAQTAMSGAAQTIDAPQDAEPMVCFAAGTRIRTARGDVAVQSLAIGDLVVTASGTTRPIRWLGSRTLDPRRHPRPHEAQPVRISAHAFGPDRPACALRVSPGHAICLDVLGEMLIPASALIDGRSVVQEEVEDVTYWHVELDSHDILLAENLPAESYLDMGNRAFFAEGPVVALAASPDADPALRTHADFCRPFHAAGPLVEAVRARLAKRAEEDLIELEEIDAITVLRLVG